MSRNAPTATLTSASPASVAGDPISGMTKNGSTKVATIAPIVLTASSEPVAVPSAAGLVAEQGRRRREREAHDDRGRQDHDAVDVRAKSRSASRNCVDAPMNGDDRRGEDRGAERDERGGQQLGDADEPGDRADVAADDAEQERADRDADRNSTRMTVNTYVELPVPAPSRRFQTTW